MTPNQVKLLVATAEAAKNLMGWQHPFIHNELVSTIDKLIKAVEGELDLDQLNEGKLCFKDPDGDTQGESPNKGEAGKED